MDPSFQVDSQAHGDYAQLTLAGELDLATVPRVEQAADALLAGEPQRLVVDLSGLRFIDSSGLRAIVVLNQRADQEGWALELVRPSEQVRRVFQISGLEERLPFIDTHGAP
jgi:anti-sigma B factor antagonist